MGGSWESGSEASVGPENARQGEMPWQSSPSGKWNKKAPWVTTASSKWSDPARHIPHYVDIDDVNELQQRRAMKTRGRGGADGHGGDEAMIQLSREGLAAGLSRGRSPIDQVGPPARRAAHIRHAAGTPRMRAPTTHDA